LVRPLPPFLAMVRMVRIGTMTTKMMLAKLSTNSKLLTAACKL